MKRLLKIAALAATNTLVYSAGGWAWGLLGFPV